MVNQTVRRGECWTEIEQVVRSNQQRNVESDIAAISTCDNKLCVWMFPVAAQGKTTVISVGGQCRKHECGSYAGEV